MYVVQTRVNLFEPIISVFVANGERYNLLNSVILEMFTFIHFHSMRNLIDYFMNTQYHRVEDVDYDSTFQLMKDKWEKMHERHTETGIATDQLQANRLQKDPRALDRGKSLFLFLTETDDRILTVTPSMTLFSKTKRSSKVLALDFVLKPPTKLFTQFVPHAMPQHLLSSSRKL